MKTDDQGAQSVLVETRKKEIYEAPIVKVSSGPIWLSYFYSDRFKIITLVLRTLSKNKTAKYRSD
jgi:hypothetical protein